MRKGPVPSEVVRYILEHWVDHPEEVQVEQEERYREITVFIKVHPDDYGKVIGKEGRILEAIKSVASSIGAKINRKITLSLVKEGERGGGNS